MRIGVFDSGVGGITVLAALRLQFPRADFTYLGDTANVPYGAKSPAQIEKLSVDCAKKLKARNVDAVVVACNTASSLALQAVRAVMGATPVFGVVEPGVEAALEALAGSGNDRAPVLVLATRATVKSGAYGRALRARLSDANAVFEQACPLLAPMIEEGWVDHPVLHQTITEYVAPHVLGKEPGVALLGCTHYPWSQAAFEMALPGWTVVDSAQAIARTLARTLKGVPDSNHQSSIEWIFTDPTAVPGFARALIKEIK